LKICENFFTEQRTDLEPITVIDKKIEIAAVTDNLFSKSSKSANLKVVRNLRPGMPIGAYVALGSRVM